MAEIHLTKNLIAIVDDIDTDLAAYKWHAVGEDNVFYAAKRLGGVGGGKIVRMHRVILERKIERPLETTEYCDHINGNTLDNRRDNLRLATSQQNRFNIRKHKNNTTGFKGVRKTWNNRYRAVIVKNGISHSLGVFDSPEEAHEAYKKAALDMFGEYARFE